jgi:hypothetical protein
MTRQQTYRTLLPVGKTNWLQGFAGVNKTSPNVKTKIIQKLTGHCPGTYGFKLSYHLVGKDVFSLCNGYPPAHRNTSIGAHFSAIGEGEPDCKPATIWRMPRSLGTQRSKQFASPTKLNGFIAF